MQQVANALGVALIGNLFDNAAGSGAADAFPRAFALCLIVLALLVLAVAALVRLLPGRLAVMPEPATAAV